MMIWDSKITVVYWILLLIVNFRQISGLFFNVLLVLKSLMIIWKLGNLFIFFWFLIYSKWMICYIQNTFMSLVLRDSVEFSDFFDKIIINSKISLLYFRFNSIIILKARFVKTHFLNKKHISRAKFLFMQSPQPLSINYFFI